MCFKTEKEKKLKIARLTLKHCFRDEIVKSK